MAGRYASFENNGDTPIIANTPDIPPINWSKIGTLPPKLLPSPDDDLPKADAVVITWAEAEWAAMVHVFRESDRAMPYSDRNKSHWDGWKKYNKDMPVYPKGGWDYWGEYCLVEINGKRVLMFKSNTHLQGPGEKFLEDLIYRIVEYVDPALVLSIGTAGGARLHDRVGTVNIVNAGTLYDSPNSPGKWPNYPSTWRPNWSMVEKIKGAGGLFFPVPTNHADLVSLKDYFDRTDNFDYSLDQLNCGDLNMADPHPLIHDLTDPSTPLLTTPTFVIANSSGNFDQFACVEMDDAIIGKVCLQSGTSFGFVRNISDPVQNVAIKEAAQGKWGHTVYTAYGLYTSYNGALAAWAILWAEAE